MVDEIVTRQELIDAKRDARDLGEAVNEVKIVSPRYGDDFKSIPMLAAESEAAINNFESTAQDKVNEWDSAINLITQEGGVPALAVSTADGENQQEINDFGGAKWRDKAGGYVAGATVKLDNGNLVRNTVAGNTLNPNEDMTGWYNFEWEQDVINDATIQKVASIADLIEYKPRKNGRVVNVLSYHPDKNVGGDLFMWRSDLSKSLHDGGYIIDPLIAIPSLAAFNTYYASQNTGTGVWVRLNNKPHVHHYNFGATTDATMVWNCAATQQSIYKAASFSTPKKVILGQGVFRCTNGIILSTFPNYGNSTRLPALIGQGKLKTELWKIANNTIPNGIYRSHVNDIDAVIFVAGRLDNASENVMDECLQGFQVMRTGVAANQGYGVYRYKSIYYDNRNINVVAASHGWYQNDCWMGQINNIRVSNSTTQAFSILGGTSVTGRNLYADGGQGGAFDLSNLTYSDLGIHADVLGQGQANGVSAIKATSAVGVRLLASTEKHKGTEFDFSACEGIIVTGMSYNTTPVATGVVPKVKLSSSQVVFEGYSWRRSLNQISTAEAAKYKLFEYDSASSNLNFKACRFAPEFKDYPQYVADFRHMGDLQFSTYSEVNRIITSKVNLANGTFKKLAYVGDTKRIKFLSGISTSLTNDRLYTFPDIGIGVANISTNSASPTKLNTSVYINGVVDSTDGGATESSRYALYGYVDTNGWLHVTVQFTGNNLEYQFVISK